MRKIVNIDDVLSLPNKWALSISKVTMSKRKAEEPTHDTKKKRAGPETSNVVLYHTLMHVLEENRALESKVRKLESQINDQAERSRYVSARMMNQDMEISRLRLQVDRLTEVMTLLQERGSDETVGELQDAIDLTAYEGLDDEETVVDDFDYLFEEVMTEMGLP